METVLDVETTFVVMEDGKKNPSSYHPDNRLVSVGYKTDTGEQGYLCFYHKEKEPTPNAHATLQDILKRTKRVIGHNLKFDLSWLAECGFEYDCEAWDTMLCEYVLARGLKPGMGLDDALARYGLGQKDASIKTDYINKGISFEDIPWEKVERYGRNDVATTFDLYHKQLDLLAMPANKGLAPTISMSNEFMLCLVDIERNGIAIDLPALDALEKEYEAERTKLRIRLYEIAQSVMGDTPINLDSPEQLSTLIYSRKIRDKKEWTRIFNLGSELRGSVRKKKRAAKFTAKEFVSHVKEQTEWVYRTKARSCAVCAGTGWVKRTLKRGTLGKAIRCRSCDGCGLHYDPTAVLAGLRQSPDNSEWVSALGFKTDGDTLHTLAARSKGIANEFFDGMARYNAVCTYLDSFVGGIRRGLQATSGELAERGGGSPGAYGGDICSETILHPEFMQAVTATGRLSSRNPNFQNQPRGNTFPIRRAIVSRWKDQGGKILEPDFAQLEFRVAVFQAQDEQGKTDVANKVDIHGITSKTLTDAGQQTDRQAAKPHTFKPLYGGMSGTDAEQTYYRSFLARYKGIGRWQTELQNTAIREKVVTLPTGRQYAFPNARRTVYGGSTGATQIKNYPVQGFATADIVPCAVIDLWRAFKRAKLKSRIINTVHDSIAIDVHPEEVRLVLEICRTVLGRITATLKERYGFEMNVPLDTDMKMGDNWLELKKIEEDKKAA